MKTLKQLRIEAGFPTINSISSYLHMSRSSWYNLETGLAYFKHLQEDLQNRIAIVLNVDKSELIHEAKPTKCVEYKATSEQLEAFLKPFGERLQPITEPLKNRKKAIGLASLSYFERKVIPEKEIQD